MTSSNVILAVEVESSREFEDNYVDLSKVINMEIDEEE